MAHFPSTRAATGDFGGKPLQDHKLVFEPTVAARNSDQRTASNDAPQTSTNHPGGRGSGESVTEEATNEDDDEDSSGHADEQEDEEDEPDVPAPSHGLGKGKGKRPAIRVEPAGEDGSQEDEELPSREAGFKTGKHLQNSMLMPNKKRTFSNVSNTSVLFGDSDESHSFPRQKLARKLSNGAAERLLTYSKTHNAAIAQGSDHAIASSDEEEEDDKDADDEDYSGVNLISDESDFEDVEQQEENWIIDNADRSSTLFQDARRLSLDSAGSDNLFDINARFDEAFFADENLTSNAFVDVGFGQFFEPEPLPTSPPAPIVNRKYSDGSAKRVRFDDEVQMSDSSSSSASELDTSQWPDLFMDQDKLPPSLYQAIENDNNTDEEFSSSGSEHSFFDAGQGEYNHTRISNLDDVDDASSEAGSSGYETDLGDTTDEYDSDDGDVFASPGPKTPRQKTVLRPPQSAPGSKASSPQAFARSTRTSTTGKFIPPLCGVFLHEDQHQAIAVHSKATKALTFYRPKPSVPRPQPNYAAYSSSASTANNSPRTSLQQFNAEDSDFSEVFNTPFQSNTDIMLTGIFGSAPASNYLFGGSTVGPPEAFYPFVSIGHNGIMDGEYEFGEDDEDFEDDLNIHDFMDFGSDVDGGDLTDVEEEVDSTDVPQTPATSTLALNGSTPAAFGSTPAHPQSTPMMETPTNRRRNVSEAMLEHFDRGIVTAFRNNQDRFRDVACLPHDPDLRASASRPIRSGRSAETFISPLRKRGSMSKKRVPPGFSGVTKATGRLSSVMRKAREPAMGTFSKH